MHDYGEEGWMGILGWYAGGLGGHLEQGLSPWRGITMSTRSTTSSLFMSSSLVNLEPPKQNPHNTDEALHPPPIWQKLGTLPAEGLHAPSQDILFYQGPCRRGRNNRCFLEGNRTVLKTTVRVF